jgi:hypothetical protein
MIKHQILYTFSTLVNFFLLVLNQYGDWPDWVRPRQFGYKNNRILDLTTLDN